MFVITVGGLIMQYVLLLTTLARFLGMFPSRTQGHQCPPSLNTFIEGHKMIHSVR